MCSVQLHKFSVLVSAFRTDPVMEMRLSLCPEMVPSPVTGHSAKTIESKRGYCHLQYLHTSSGFAM